MKMRLPSIPLITVDPYFSVWSNDKINTHFPVHWTGSRNAILGLVIVDGEELRFLGEGYGLEIPQISIDIDAFSTIAIFKNEKIELEVKFTTPILADSLYYASRPVSYLKLSYKSVDNKKHDVKVKITVSEELVLNKAGEGRALYERVESEDLTCIKMGRANQTVLNSCGDDIRIDWGYFYLATNGDAKYSDCVISDLYSVSMESALDNEKLFIFAYDDVDSIIYFEKPLKAYWKKYGKNITKVIIESFIEYDSLIKRCEEFSLNLKNAAIKAGGEKYAELLLLAYRQVMAAHKLVIDENGENLYISKECFSNGCAATVDITYPSAPMFLYYNTELLKATIRPILRFARSKDWNYDFAPHDVGCYPILNGQVYDAGNINKQMPVEECGNMLIMTAAVTKAIGNTELFDKYSEIAGQWAEYLSEFGADPDNQLCTDDFAGHLAHNCNLALKSVFALASYAKLCSMTGDDIKAEYYEDLARKNAGKWRQKAANGDGTYKLTFDRPGTFSMKYNAVWDKVFDLGIFPENMWEDEIKGYEKHFNPYGLPLDSRSDCTKSDWMIWAATLSGDDEFFKKTVDALWLNYNLSPSRVPLNDLFSSVTSLQIHFQHRSVQGGMFIKLLDSEKICSLKK